MVVELPYSLHTRYASIAIAWTVILVPPVFLNIGLFYGLWYGKPDLDRLLGTHFDFSMKRDHLQSLTTKRSPHPANRHPRHLHRHSNRRAPLQTPALLTKIPSHKRIPLRPRHLPMRLLLRSHHHLRAHLLGLGPPRYRRRRPRLPDPVALPSRCCAHVPRCDFGSTVSRPELERLESTFPLR